jgi:hypothetical protein
MFYFMEFNIESREGHRIENAPLSEYQKFAGLVFGGKSTPHRAILP